MGEQRAEGGTGTAIVGGIATEIDIRATGERGAAGERIGTGTGTGIWTGTGTGAGAGTGTGEANDETIPNLSVEKPCFIVKIGLGVGGHDQTMPMPLSMSMPEGVVRGRGKVGGESPCPLAMGVRSCPRFQSTKFSRVLM